MLESKKITLNKPNIAMSVVPKRTNSCHHESSEDFMTYLHFCSFIPSPFKKSWTKKHRLPCKLGKIQHFNCLKSDFLSIKITNKLGVSNNSGVSPQIIHLFIGFGTIIWGFSKNPPIFGLTPNWPVACFTRNPYHFPFWNPPTTWALVVCHPVPHQRPHDTTCFLSSRWGVAPLPGCQSLQGL